MLAHDHSGRMRAVADEAGALRWPLAAPAETDNVVEFPLPPSRTSAALADLYQGLIRGWFWTALAAQDIKLRYRGSLLGPFWQTISTLIMIGSMGVIYATLFHMKIETYLPMLAAGLIFWQFISGMITDGCETFTFAENIIQQVKVPLSLHAYRMVCRNVFILGHNLVIVPLVLAIFPTPMGASVITVLPGFVVLTVNGVWIGLLLGMLSARFRDVPPIVNSFVQVVFFVTPIFWSLDALHHWKSVAQFNPLFAAIDVVRAPLLGQAPAPYSWLLVLGITLVGSLGTFFLFARFRARIAFWV